ncbi:zinc-binding protein [Candidatus Liberibacter solanacearum CLso-ZC1]|uniref:DNA gyrase inhibitor YacG n=1 Tax=Liberibacter solanacearum (strain CLso-ZC1) TaxID=658172 RepID=E4UCI6_LIBSC|nr:DNA gyrase inhibitor YacG [Candidatus Liberibacter solanacearum]ADR52076.1 zinc-binding protein [Candidatus Liberibacter solanacearum CLso-ZC1]
MQKSDCELVRCLCPECRKDSVSAFYPFCSTRCRSIDLSRWLSDGYVIVRTENEAFNKEEDIS